MSTSRAGRLAIVAFAATAAASWGPPNGDAPSWGQPSWGQPSWPGASDGGASCAPQAPGAIPSFHFGSFSFPSTPTPTTSVTSNTASGLPTTTYAVPYSLISKDFANISTTSWGNWVSQATFTEAADAAPYGDSAWTALWQVANPHNFTTGIYSTTVSPTPVPTSELQSPPNLFLTPKSCYKFPKDFAFGVASSAAQCEGATADQGKSPTIQDLLYNLLTLVGLTGAAGTLVGTNGASTTQPNYVALEQYYLYKQDIERFAAMGTKYYAFSIAWSRILPFALPGTPINSYGVQHYHDMIDFIYEKGMTPIVTITHFDTPLQLFGGGANWLETVAADAKNATYGLAGVSFGYDNDTFVDAYAHYSRIVLAQYASKVPYWITFNEPQLGSTNGIAVSNVLKAHAQAYHYYKDVLKGTGQVSLKMGVTPGVPLVYNNQSDLEATKYFNDLYIGAYLNPLALGEDYPEAYKITVPDYVPLTTEDIEYMNGTLDFTAIDAYVAPVITKSVENITACAININDPAHTFPYCVLDVSKNPAGWAIGYSPFGSGTNYDAPLNFRTQLKYTYDTWKLPVFVTEFGLSIPTPPGDRLQDNLFNVPQSRYYLSYLDEILKSIWEDGVNVIGALMWTFADDWEFGTYIDGFGIQYNNRTTQTRIYRRSYFDVMGFMNEHS